jgi:hypothetical protein
MSMGRTLTIVMGMSEFFMMMVVVITIMLMILTLDLCLTFPTTANRTHNTPPIR